MDTLGLDEAGRGPVLGPMVMAGIVIPEKKEKIIERMGVKDSKRLTPNRRAVLYRKLTKMFDYETVVITAKDIDTLRAKGINLNQIEKLAMKKIINTLRADRIIIDALDVKEGRLQEEMELGIEYISAVLSHTTRVYFPLYSSFYFSFKHNFHMVEGNKKGFHSFGCFSFSN
jgi:ribonuclease HII